MAADKFLKPEKTALLLIDLQNDFLHPEGAYGRAGQSSPQTEKVLNAVQPMVEACRKAGTWIISSQFTLVPGRGGEPMIDPHLKNLRPFLGKGDFAPGSFGHDLMHALKPADFYVEKVAYSAFHQTRLEFILQKMQIDTVLIAGIVTNGGVASTARDSHTRGYRTLVLKDACAAFRDEVHSTTIESLGYLVETPSVEEAISLLQTKKA